MTGQEMYERWCGPAPSDWALLDSGETANWERLAAEIEAAQAAVWNDAVIIVGEALQDAWERRERRRCNPSMT